jgi:hypothetical protein
MNPSDGNISFKNLTASTSVEQSITVTSVNGVTTKEYKVKIVQESNTTMLSDLTVSTGTLSPAFNPFIKNYTVTVPYSVTNLIVTGKKSDANATMDPPDGNLLFMNLAAGISEKKSIRITSKNKRVKNEYNVKVIRSGEIYTSETIGKLMFVPAGSFQRDLNSDCISNITKPYSLSKCPITRQQFLDIMREDPSDTEFSSGSMNDPVQNVNWYHAITFCNKLSIKENLSPAYSVKKDGQELDWKNLPSSAIPTRDNYDENTADYDDYEDMVGDIDWNNVVCDWDATGYRLPTEMEWMWPPWERTKMPGKE